jgi:hypothetical protein
MIRAGLVLQLVFLLFVDWGTVAGMRSEPDVPWFHIAGLIVVNVVLIASGYFAWIWMRRAQASHDLGHNLGRSS